MTILNTQLIDCEGVDLRSSLDSVDGLYSKLLAKAGSTGIYLNNLKWAGCIVTPVNVIITTEVVQETTYVVASAYPAFTLRVAPDDSYLVTFPQST